MSRTWDVMVIGAGPAGVSAAVAARLSQPRAGAAGRPLRVLLVERYGFAGGMATAALVNPFAGNCYVNPDTGGAGDIVAGVFAEVLRRLRDRSAVRRCLFSPERTRFYDAFDETQLRIVYDRMLAEAGVEVLFHAWLLDARVSGGRVESVRVLTKGGVETLPAAHYIDSTGDADLAASAGAPFDVGRPEDGLCQPGSMMFRMGGVDKSSLLDAGLDAARRRATEYYVRAREAGRLEFPFKPWLMFYDYPRPGALHFNATRVCRWSGLSSWELSAAEREGRRQVVVLADWLRSEAPWFRHAYLETVGPQIGVRETRRVRGRYRMTGDDVREGGRFADGVIRSGYFIDIHDPTGAAAADVRPEPTGRLGGAPPERIPRRHYEVPFGCLQPAGVENLLVACRAISADFEAHAAVRVMANMHGIGEAAGRAAALAASRGISLAEVDGAEVRKAVGYLDDPLGF